MDDSKWATIQSLQFKDPTISLIVSLIGGQLGIDRFLIGDTGLGVGKLLTCGGLGIWTIIDWFLIMGATKEKNMEKIQQVIYYSTSSHNASGTNYNTNTGDQTNTLNS